MSRGLFPRIFYVASGRWGIACLNDFVVFKCLSCSVLLFTIPSLFPLAPLYFVSFSLTSIFRGDMQGNSNAVPQFIVKATIRVMRSPTNI